MFAPATGRVGQTFYERIDYQAALQYGEPEEGTLLWWQKQSDEARHEAFGGKARPDVVARALRTFIASHCAKPRVPWGNGAVFDIALLQSWFDRVDPQKDDQGNDRYPWSFWDVADLPTLVRLSGIDVRAILYRRHPTTPVLLYVFDLKESARQGVVAIEGLVAGQSAGAADSKVGSLTVSAVDIVSDLDVFKYQADDEVVWGTLA